MNVDRTAEAAFLNTIARLGRLLAARDPSIVDEFVEDAILVGSEAGEIVRGRLALESFFAQFQTLPASYTWEWCNIDHTINGTIGWFFAEGWSVATANSTERRREYRLSGVLSHDGVRWKWRLFSGSEPVA